MKVVEFGSEFDWDSNISFQVSTSNEYFDEKKLQKYRSGRDALKAVAREYKKQTRKILLPALCCESMVSPFVMNGYQAVFYKMNAEYTADTVDVEKKLEKGCLFLYMPYFGISPFTAAQLKEWKEKYECVFIEDRTQNALHNLEEGEFNPDITISSIRKWLAIPDGGLLWSEKRFAESGKEELKFAQIRFEALQKKSTYLSNGVQAVKNQYREMLQRAAEKLDEEDIAYNISAQSNTLLRQMDFAKILLARQQNVAALKKSLDIAVNQGKIVYMTQYPEKSTLYFPILVDCRDALQRELAQRNIYCPVIWPIPQAARGVCETAEYTAKHMLALPCDQRYTTEDMEYIAATVKLLLNDRV